MSIKKFTVTYLDTEENGARKSDSYSTLWGAICVSRQLARRKCSGIQINGEPWEAVYHDHIMLQYSD